MDFYERVKCIAKERNIPLLQMLKDNGINYESYKSAKRLGILPRADEACKIAEALHTTVEYLVTGQGRYISAEQLIDLANEVEKKFSELLRPTSE